MRFIDSIKERAKSDIKTIVLPESMDRRTFQAAEVILKEKIANLIIIGTDEVIAENSKGLDISGAKIINPYNYYKTQDYIEVFYELRKSKGMTPEKAKDIIMNDYMYYACMMVKFFNIKAIIADNQSKIWYKNGFGIFCSVCARLSVWRRWNICFCRCWT